jgi:membrane-associated protease RseP (regulator of RpoE activity)
MSQSEERASGHPALFHLGLFLATLASVSFMGFVMAPSELPTMGKLTHGLAFSGTLLSILVAHEFGHYFAARLHRVPATLPYFIPMPLLSPFGTMGAIIRMQGAIGSRRALLDIGAAGPLAGLCLAIPLYIVGARTSTIVPTDSIPGAVELGEPILTRLLDRLSGAPRAPAGMTTLASPVYFGAWGGMLITWLNLLPVGQLDGGHVAYALLGKRQDKAAIWVHRLLLVIFAASLLSPLLTDVRRGFGLLRVGEHASASMFWFLWFQMLAILGTVGRSAAEGDGPRVGIRTRLVASAFLLTIASVGQKEKSLLLWGAWFAGLIIFLTMDALWGVLRPHGLFDHPEVSRERLGVGRTIIAVVTLLFFLLLFMPAPMTM